MNSIIIQGLIQFSASVVIAFFLLPLLIKAAPKLGLLDNPNARKVHLKPTPLVGGLAMLIIILCAAIVGQLLSLPVLEHYEILVATLLIFMVASWDDRAELSPKVRLFIQIVAALFVAGSGIRIESLNGLFGIHELPLFAQYALTILVITGVVNAFNLMDGVNGLVGGLALVNALVLALLTWVVHMPELTMLLLALAGGLVVFLKYNSNPAKVFMGDGGSMMLGFLFAAIAIKVLQMTHIQHKPAATLSLMVLTLFLIPVIDALRVFIFRFTKGLSILQPDKSHLHHLILIMGSSHSQVTGFIVGLQAVLIVAAPFLAAYCSVSVVIVFYIVLLVTLSKLLSFNRTMIDWQNSVKQHEIINN